MNSCLTIRKEIYWCSASNRPQSGEEQHDFFFHSFWKLGSFVLLLELGPVSAAVGGDMVCVLLDDGEHDHLKDNQDVLDRLLDVLHVQPEMVGFDHACFS